MNTLIRRKGHNLTQLFWMKAIITPSILFLSLPSYSGDISVDPMQHSPIPAQVTPMFVSLGFDDNLDVDGMSWVLRLLGSNKNPDGADAFANSSLKASFFMHCGPARGNDDVLTKWRQAHSEGHDIGNHTETHPDDKVNWNPLESWMTIEQWQQEITQCNELLMASEAQGGVGLASVSGYRAPFLTYNDNTFRALSDNHIQYDVSLPAGNTPEHDGTNNYWPYTLHNGSPEHDIGVNNGWKPPLSNYPNLWEIPLHTLIVPPDNEMDRYGLAYSLRDKIASRVPWFDAISGKGDNFDWNLYFEPAWGAAGLNENDVLAIYKYNLDLRLSGNKSPLVLGLHSGFYGYQNGQEHFGMPESTVESRRRVLEKFTEYALSKPEVRFVSHKQLVDWMEEPEPLTLCSTSEWDAHKAYKKGDGVTYMGEQYQAAWWTMQQIPGLYENSPWKSLDACTPEQ
ncbi:polysaccharide deacetylase family protein [Enterovibrio sp. ZSDZ42]|uniref:Polysaccharide deacetylase family protein n=1 Tax=Enterovibrio gelatinilyticus TaxID=2899819 RepID=A0ABT5QU57_9GAMM|nr:polysaccharide deacetylase family protein [Enterovibrio sp. ZSDZ42]MDD1791553.1 polysaccharide deacetylase family protein [Enterovibrio sp. ZSDZ42]